MRTVVQVRHPAADSQPRAELVWGRPLALEAGALGPVALFGAGEIVAYLLRFRRRPRLFVFRTLTVDDRLAATLPGVRPRVQLLLELRTQGRIRRARSLFAYLARTRRDPSALTDAFYVRVGLVLAGRLPSHKVLLSLLPPPQAPSDSPAMLSGSVPSTRIAPVVRAPGQGSAAENLPRASVPSATESGAGAAERRGPPGGRR